MAAQMLSSWKMEATLTTTTPAACVQAPPQSSGEADFADADFQSLLQELLPSASSASQVLIAPTSRAHSSAKYSEKLEKTRAPRQDSDESAAAQIPELPTAIPVIAPSTPLNEPMPTGDPNVLATPEPMTGQVIPQEINTSQASGKDKTINVSVSESAIAVRSISTEQDAVQSVLPPPIESTASANATDPLLDSAKKNMQDLAGNSNLSTKANAAVQKPSSPKSEFSPKKLSDPKRPTMLDHSISSRSTSESTPSHPEAHEDITRADGVTPPNAQNERTSTNFKPDTQLPSPSYEQHESVAVRRTPEPAVQDTILMSQPDLSRANLEKHVIQADLQSSEPVPQIQNAELQHPSSIPELKVELKIEDFGRVQVSASLRNENVHTLLKIENADARNVLSSEIGRSDTSITRHDIRVEPFDSAASNNGQGGRSQSRDPQPPFHLQTRQTRLWSDTPPPILSLSNTSLTSNFGLDLLA